MAEIEVIDTTTENIARFGICSYKDLKQEGFKRKVDWMGRQSSGGLVIKTLYSDKDKAQGMIEYIPGEYCWRPVDAAGYMFIHCIFVGFKKAFKGQGYGTLLLKACIDDAKKAGMNGVAVVTREGTWMAKKELFLKNGFEVVDKAKPDFELLALKFDKGTPSPAFRDMDSALKRYGKGLFIIRSDQCPAVSKPVNEIMVTAEKEYGIKPEVIELKTYKDAQDSPCPFGNFCVIHDGKIVAHAPISNTRFKNIMNKFKD
jgi:GNAT superfamily N-acetyltransferase